MALGWFGLGFGLGVLATIALALVLRPQDDSADVHCPRCDPHRSILEIHDGSWWCLDCGYHWDDPDLPRGWARVDGRWHAFPPDVH